MPPGPEILEELHFEIPSATLSTVGNDGVYSLSDVILEYTKYKDDKMGISCKITAKSDKPIIFTKTNKLTLCNFIIEFKELYAQEGTIDFRDDIQYIVRNYGPLLGQSKFDVEGAVVMHAKPVELMKWFGYTIPAKKVCAAYCAYDDGFGG